MKKRDNEYDYFFPIYFSSEKKFEKYYNDSSSYRTYCLGNNNSFYKEEVSREEKYRREYLWNEFSNWRDWKNAGRNIISFSQDLLLMLNKTDVEHVELSDLQFPYNNFYLSLRYLNIPFVEGENETVDGVYIAFEKNPEPDGEATYEFCISLDFTGDYEKYAIQYNDSISELYNFTFKNYRLYFDKKDNILTVEQALRQNKDYFQQEIIVVNDKNKAMDVFSFNQSLIERTIRIVINCLLYISTSDADIKQEYGTDLPEYLNKKLSKANTDRKKEAVSQEIKIKGFTKINFIGQSFNGIYKKASRLVSEISPHWRRGHWRKQKHGEGLILSKLLWIQPTLVNKEIGEPINGHIYEVNKERGRVK